MLEICEMCNNSQRFCLETGKRAAVG